MFGLKYKDYEDKIVKLEEMLDDKDRQMKLLERSFSKQSFEFDQLQSDYKKLERAFKEAQGFLKENIEGKTIAEYTRPEIIDLVEKYKSLVNENKKTQDRLAAERKQFEFDKQIDRKGIEIEFLNKYSQKQDSLMTLLATKAPVQNMMIEKKDITDSRREKDYRDRW